MGHTLVSYEVCIEVRETAVQNTQYNIQSVTSLKYKLWLKEELSIVHITQHSTTRWQCNYYGPLSYENVEIQNIIKSVPNRNKTQLSTDLWKESQIRI